VRAALSKSEGLYQAALGLNQVVDQCFTQVQQIAVVDLREQVQDFAERQNAELFFDSGQARAVAFNCDALRVLANTFQASPSDIGRLAEGERLLSVINQLLAGGIIWEFPPSKPGAKSKSR
jgi:hypothetical protein